MADGPCDLAFAQEAEKDGIVLAEPWFNWLCEQGHLGLDRIADESEDDEIIDRAVRPVEVLSEIYSDLGGDLAVRYSCRGNMFIPGDFVHEPTNTLIEVDEAFHFTSFRLLTLDLYPKDIELGFDIDEYRDLCRKLAPDYDRYKRAVAAKGFGIGGVQRERAYQDAIRDLGAAVVGHPPVIRIPAIDGDGAAAYARSRDALLKRLGTPAR
ncbi:MAG TPA: hypothetical protein VG165_07735 [Solirubrobacteraceae bacterium]|nr:hypothetical protein [Solirubrobacteraceae bacterium]